MCPIEEEVSILTGAAQCMVMIYLWVTYLCVGDGKIWTNNSFQHSLYDTGQVTEFPRSFVPAK